MFTLDKKNNSLKVTSFEVVFKAYEIHNIPKSQYCVLHIQSLQDQFKFSDKISKLITVDFIENKIIFYSKIDLTKKVEFEYDLPYTSEKSSEVENFIESLRIYLGMVVYENR